MTRPAHLVQGTLDLLVLEIVALETANWERLAGAISRVVRLTEV